jgi:hypothetical protein
MSEIIKVKIPKTVAGIKIPYDLIYLITREQRELVHKLWDFALVMPFEESFQRVIFELYPRFYSKLGRNRNDAELKLSINPATKESPLPIRVRKSEQRNLATAWWATIAEEYALSERLVVVPILLQRKEEKLLPRYLGAKRWMDRQAPYATSSRKTRSLATTELKLTAPQVAQLAPPISDLAYLSTPYPLPNDKLRPLCSICPRSFQHLQGQCIPGMAVCYTHLDITNIISSKKLPVINDASFAQSGIYSQVELAPARIEDEEIPF